MAGGDNDHGGERESCLPCFPGEKHTRRTAIYAGSWNAQQVPRPRGRADQCARGSRTPTLAIPLTGKPTERILRDQRMPSGGSRYPLTEPVCGQSLPGTQSRYQSMRSRRASIRILHSEPLGGNREGGPPRRRPGRAAACLKASSATNSGTQRPRAPAVAGGGGGRFHIDPEKNTPRIKSTKK